MADLKLATFRIDGDKWLQFQAKAKENGTNASALLLGFVQSYLDGLDISLDSSSKNIDGNLATHLDNLSNRLDSLDRGIDERIQQAIAPLESRLGELHNLIQATSHPPFQTGTEPPQYKTAIDVSSVAVGNDVPATGEKSSDRTPKPTKKVPAKAKPPQNTQEDDIPKADGKRWLTTSQALELAEKRGYSKARRTFSREAKEAPQELGTVYRLRSLRHSSADRTLASFEDLDYLE